MESKANRTVFEVLWISPYTGEAEVAHRFTDQTVAREYIEDMGASYTVPMWIEGEVMV